MDYIAEANSTASNQFHGELVSLDQFNAVLNNAIDALHQLDRIKKAIFYGRALSSAPVELGVWNCNKLTFEISGVPELAIHGIIGAATECGELLEALSLALRDGSELDAVNIKEETGDVFWYLAILAKSQGFTFEECQETNIAKLRKRFPDKFTEYDALNRDLNAERNVLENKPTAPAVPTNNNDEKFAL